MKLGSPTLIHWQTTIFLISTRIVVVLVGTIQLGWDIIHLKSTTSSCKEPSAAASIFPRQPIAPTRIQNKRVIIGRNTKAVFPTTLLCPSFIIILITPFLTRGHVSMDWMASDVDFERLYLFKKPEGCCKQWFSTDVNGCVNTIIQGKYEISPCPTNRPDCKHTSSVTNATAALLSMWYPDLWKFKCKNDKLMPEYMLNPGFRDMYLFSTEKQCCAEFKYC
ncbi:hypothetical protein ACHAXA_003021 [Cyclostephanos tholiformis]|uniref:Uncharacterized protein n=1 Tax=Cyclostephanos tholiformis TaxID=382380 RepID=A0ABD3R7Y2_9STRA